MGDNSDGNPTDFSGFEGQFSALTAAAVQIHELYEAYVKAGFSADQALQILLVQVATAQRGGGHE